MRHLPFSELATNVVFKIIDKEITKNNKYVESLLLFLQSESFDEIIKTYATSYLKQK